jgi:hypothetical protein
VAVDLSTGSLIYYDFGMMGEIVPTTRENLLEVGSVSPRASIAATTNALISNYRWKYMAAIDSIHTYTPVAIQ